jgi:hypothetical protein
MLRLLPSPRSNERRSSLLMPGRWPPLPPPPLVSLSAGTDSANDDDVTKDTVVSVSSVSSCGRGNHRGGRGGGMRVGCRGGIRGFGFTKRRVTLMWVRV